MSRTIYEAGPSPFALRLLASPRGFALSRDGLTAIEFSHADAKALLLALGGALAEPEPRFTSGIVANLVNELTATRAEIAALDAECPKCFHRWPDCTCPQPPNGWDANGSEATDG